jgi:hypothetical protein
MRWCPVAFVLVVLVGGCSSSPGSKGTRHYGPRVNVNDFLRNTAAYKGKLITLNVRIDERITSGQTLRDYAGRSIKVAAEGPKGQQLRFVITIPQGLSVPDIGHSDNVRVTFVCTRGDLHQGNEAKLIEVP